MQQLISTYETLATETQNAQICQLFIPWGRGCLNFPLKLIVRKSANFFHCRGVGGGWAKLGPLKVPTTLTILLSGGGGGVILPHVETDHFVLRGSIKQRSF